MKREFVNVDTEVFSATVPSVGMLKADVILKVMLLEKDSTQQFVIMVEEFRKNLTDERREAFDALTMDDWVTVISHWMTVSADENVDVATEEKKKKRKWNFWK